MSANSGEDVPMTGGEEQSVPSASTTETVESQSATAANPNQDKEDKKDEGDSHAEPADGEGEDDGKEDATGFSSPKPRKPKNPTVAAPPPEPASLGVSSRGRQRKSVQAYVPPSPKKFEEEFIVEPGEGTELGEIENVRRHIDGINSVADEMKVAFHACYPHMKTGSTKNVIKRNIRAFSGYSDVKGQSELAREKLERYENSVLKQVCHIFDISVSGTKANLIDRIVEFCSKPTSSGRSSSSSSSSSSTKKRKSTSKSSKKSKSKSKDGDSDKPKRVNPFMLFSSEHRPKLMKKYSDIKEIARKLGEMWRELSEKEQQEYKDRAANRDTPHTVSGSESDSSSSEDESDEEEEEKERPKKKVKSVDSSKKEDEADAMPADLKQAISKSIQDMIEKTSDLSTLTMKLVKGELASTHGELVVEAHSAAIKVLVLKAIQQKQKAK